MIATASAVWNGDLKAGHGTISSHSGVLKGTQYSFKSRFEEGTGTNPEELIAAAHAGCFSMAFANMLAQGGHVAISVATNATVTLEHARRRPDRHQDSSHEQVRSPRHRETPPFSTRSPPRHRRRLSPISRPPAAANHHPRRDTRVNRFTCQHQSSRHPAGLLALPPSPYFCGKSPSFNSV